MKPPAKQSTRMQHIRHTDQDSGDEVPDDTEDEFLGSMFVQNGTPSFTRKIPNDEN